jgi:L-lysine 6-transaminase
MAVAVGKRSGVGAVYTREPLEDVDVLDSTWGGTLADTVRVVQEVKVVEEEDLITLVAVKEERLAAGLGNLRPAQGVPYIQHIQRSWHWPVSEFFPG